MDYVYKPVLYNWRMDNETIIIFGRSPFINEIRDYIPRLINNFHTVGINQFYQSFNTEYTAFCDLLKPSNLPKITGKLLMSTFANPYWVKYKNKEVFEIVHNRFEFSEELHKLNYFFHTPSVVLNWAYLKGFKRAILVGIDLMPNTGHFDNPNFMPDWSNDNIKLAKEHLEKVCTKYLDLYTLNPNSVINLPYLNVNELVKEGN